MTDGAPTTFRTGKIFRALGVKDHVEPKFARTPMQPTAVLADLSRSFAPSRVEARQLFGSYYPSTGANYVKFQYQSRAAGGSIVEAFSLSNTVYGTGWIAISETPEFALGAGSVANALNIGGEESNSILMYAQAAGGLITGGRPFSLPLSITAEMYIPPGHFFIWVCSNGAAAANTTTIGFLVRDIPESLGDP